MSIPDYRTARQLLNMRHGRYTMPVLRDDGSTGELAICVCGAHWPCPTGVLLENATAQETCLAVYRTQIEQQHALIGQCRALLEHIHEEISPPNEYDRHEALIEQIDELLQRLPEVRHARADQG